MFDDISNSYYHSPGSYRSTDNSSCVRGITPRQDHPRQPVPVTLAEDCGISVSVDVCHTDFSLGISKREHGFPVNVSERKQGFPFDASGRGQGFSSRCLGTRTSSFALRGLGTRDFRVIVASHVPDHHRPLPAICGCLNHTLMCFYGTRRVSADNWPMHVPLS